MAETEKQTTNNLSKYNIFSGPEQKRSILFKFFLIFTVVVVVTAVVSGFLLSGMVKNYMLKSRRNDMEKVIEALNSQWSDYQSAYMNAVDSEGNWISQSLRSEYDLCRSNLMSSLELYESFLGEDSYIFIASIDGKIEFSYPLMPSNDRYAAGRTIVPEKISDKLKKTDTDYYFKQSEQYSRTVKNSESTGDFFGLYRDCESEYFTIRKLIKYYQPNIGEWITGGSIIVSVAVPHIEAAQKAIIGFFVISTLISILIELVLLIYFTKRLTDPLVELQKAAAKVAAGDFSYRITKKSNDEIGMLVESFNSMTEALANLDSMRNDFIASVSHELRTPMTSIGGFIDAILDGVIPDDKRDHYLGIVKSEITRLTSLVNELLNMARLQSGATKLKFEYVDINRIAIDVIDKLEPIISEKQLNTDVNFEHTEEFAWADVSTIDRVFINLIQNATKFTNSGGTITVHTARTRNAVEVTVEDTGKGIPPEEQKMVFERFYKTDKSRGLDKKGMGLGLALCKSIMKAHGTDIRVESELNVGSKFIFTLPLENPDPDDQAEETKL